MDINYKIVEEIGVLSKSAKGWRKELNIISWNGAVTMKPKPWFAAVNLKKRRLPPRLVHSNFRLRA